MLNFSVLCICAYLVGSIPVAYLLVKMYRGVDIRNYGSGGVGASNVFRNFSKPLGILVGIFDAGKGALMIWIAQLLSLNIGLQTAIGLAVVIGHNWSVFMRFNAGRGVSTTLGIDLILMPWLVIIIAAGIIVILLSGSSPVPVLVGIALMPVGSWLLHKPLALTLGLVAFWVLMVVRRLTAPRTDRSSAISAKDLLLNRFLFDRDIRDGKEWIKFKRISNPKKQ